MKTLLIAALAGVFLFAASAAVSWYLMNQQQLAQEQPAATEPDELNPASKLPPVTAKVEKVDQMPVGLRPDTPITVESVMELSRSIRKTEQQLIEREKQVQKDEAGMELLFADLKRERDELTAFSTQIESKLRTYRELVEQLKIENEKLEATKKQLAKNAEAADAKQVNQVSTEIKSRVDMAKKYMAEMDDKIVAGLLRQSADSGELVFASEVLKSLDERKGGRVLEALEDPGLVDLLLRTGGITKSGSR